ncbi:MAG: PLP-dependent aminotransferase family protein [Betaproteobacteria bacterium]
MIDYDRSFSRTAATMQESAIRKMSALALRVPDLVSFAPGFPAPDLFAWDELRDIARELLDGRESSVLQYGATRGYRPLIEALIEILAGRGATVTADEVIVTTGSQQALDLTARIFVDPGDVVLVELPTYTGAITAFRNAQSRLVGVRQDDDGIDLEDLARALARERGAGRRVAFLYVVPNFQNPTGLLISRDKRRRLLEWAAREDVLIVEDDPYGALHFDDVATAAETRPIKADDRDGRVVYMSSFSKTLAPGFRVAWIAAPPPIVAKLEVAKQAADLCTGPLDQRIVCEAWRRGVITSRLPILRRGYQEKRTAMEAALHRELDGMVSWTQPKGGFFLWVALPGPIDTDALLTRALEHGVVYVAGSAFFVDGRASRYARLSFSAPSAERIQEGVRRLAAAVRPELKTTASTAPTAS